MSLSAQNIRTLRAAAHTLKPIIMLGKAGLSAATLVEINVALDHHELIKVKVRSEDRAERKAVISQLVEKTGAALIQTIGMVTVIYRKSEKNIPRKKSQKAHTA